MPAFCPAFARPLHEKKPCIWRDLWSIQNEAISLVAMRCKELWLVEKNSAPVKPDTSLTISLNRKILIFYEHLKTFTQSLRVLWIYAPLRNAELVRKEEALYLRFFTQELTIRKFWISCCARWMKTYSESRLNCEIYTSWRKCCKTSQLLSSEQPCEPKSLDVALKITGLEQNTLGKLVVTVNPEGIWFEFWMKGA